MLNYQIFHSQNSLLLIIVQRVHALANVFGHVFMAVTRYVQDLVGTIVLVNAKTLACILVLACAEMAVEMGANLHALAVVVVLALDLLFNHVKIAPILVHPLAKVGVAHRVLQVVCHLAKMAAKKHVVQHVKEAAILDVVLDVIKAAKEPVIAVVLALVIPDAVRHARMDVKELAQTVVLVHAQVTVTQGVLLPVGELVQDRAF